MPQRYWSLVCLLLLFALLATGTASAQGNNYFNQRDDTYRLLGLKRALETYKAALAEYDRQQSLFKKGMITAPDLERARNIFVDAEVNYQQSLLAVLFEEQFVTVKEAVKYQAVDGSKRVRLTLANTSGGTAEFKKLLNMEDELFKSLQPEIINDVYVSLLNDDQAIISQPYETKIEQLVFGSPETVDFALLQDVDEAAVSIIYGKGSQRVMKIVLQKDVSANQVIVQSEQFSQEVELGSTASFDLTLELFSGESDSYALYVLNLPREIGRYFEDQARSARLSQVRFTESSRTKRASLEVTLPDRANDQVAMDAPIPFYVVVVPRDLSRTIRDRVEDTWTEAEIKTLGVGYARLELITRGRGRLMARIPQMYHAINTDEQAELSMEVTNDGSHDITNAEVKLDLPLNWTGKVEPEAIDFLAIGKDARVSLKITPPEDISPGKYEVRVRTSAVTAGQPISSEDKSVTIEILAESNTFGTIAVVVLLLGVVGGIVIYGTKLSRR